MVKNHPGAMSHITGLFSRRGFNLEGILCAPVDGGADSAMYLLVKNDERLEQIVKQLRKLYDVKSVVVKDDYILAHHFKETEESTLFGHLEALIQAFEAEQA
ncbi:MAG TPA: ACT domain-containing protein [Spirochaetia bacterium]|nr:ACT domain-containing protein [Spirochaetia bacterium]